MLVAVTEVAQKLAAFAIFFYVLACVFAAGYRIALEAEKYARFGIFLLFNKYIGVAVFIALFELENTVFVIFEGVYLGYLKRFAVGIVNVSVFGLAVFAIEFLGILLGAYVGTFISREGITPSPVRAWATTS